jgi:signal recognition particle receptor subunit beta
MPVFDHASKMITCKLVYYGPARSGKSTNLNYLHSALPGDQVGSLVSLSRRRDRTLSFDYVPTEIGKVGAYRVRFQLCTVPGTTSSGATRQAMLQGADGIAFIVDSRQESLQANLDCLHDLHLLLADQQVAARSLPFVFQYNLQNLPADEVHSPEQLSSELNFRNAPEYAANAMDGTGVIDTMRGLAMQVLRHLGVRGALHPEPLDVAV